MESAEEHFAEKAASHGYAQEEVYFANGDIELSGIVFTPRTGGPHPAVVFIHGSGVSVRDGLGYQLIANHLVNAGIAVLLPDKRGCGKSGGRWEVASFEDFARDTLAGVELLKTLVYIDPERIGLVGISQGGWIAPLAASLSSDVAFVVDISGTTVTPNEQLLHESEQTMIQRGTPAAAARAMAGTAARIAKARRPTWWKKNGDFDPIPHWTSMEIPGLLLFGDEDENDNVPVQASVDRINEHVPRERDVTVKVFQGTGHSFVDTETGRLREDFLDYLAGWLKTKTDT